MRPKINTQPRIPTQADFDWMRVPVAYRSATRAKMQGIMFRNPSTDQSVRCPAFEFAARYRNRVLRGDIDLSLLLFGDRGVGKTSIAVWLLMQFRAFVPGSRCLFTTLSELRRIWKDPAGSEPITVDENMYQRVQSVNFLVIDNLQEEDAKERYGMTPTELLNLIQFRRGRGYYTILTSAIGGTDLERLYSGIYHDPFVLQGFIYGDDLSVSNTTRQVNLLTPDS